MASILRVITRVSQTLQTPGQARSHAALPSILAAVLPTGIVFGG